MLAELHKCPSLYATTSNNVVTMVRMTLDTQRLAVYAVTDTQTFKAEFDESLLLAMKDKAGGDVAAGTWEKFFDELQSSFNQGKVMSKTGETVECILSQEGAKYVFQLQLTKEDGQKLVLDSLLNYLYVHAHSRDVEKQLDEIGKKEQDARMAALELEREEQALKDVIQRSKEQDEVSRAKLVQLQAELVVAEEEKRKEGGVTNDVDEKMEEEQSLCRARNPLGRKDHKDYDAELLRLVKGKWITAESPFGGPDMLHNAIIRPYTSSELEMQTKSFSSSQREVIWDCLKKVDEWGFDIFRLQSILTGDDHGSLAFQQNGGALFYTTYSLMLHHGCFQKFNIDEKIVMNWLSVIEAGYHANPYHNSMHAADVEHIMHFVLKCGGLIKKCKLTDEDVFAALFAAAIHDYDHPGINNSFHVKAGTYLATLYNDKSVLENRHVSSVFELMKLPKFNILAGLTEDQKRDVRETMIEMVLATDMGLHAKYVGQFKRRLHENHDFVKKDDIRLALSMAVKLADISNCGRPRDIYLRWGAKIADEFYMQGDKERALGMPCSPFMDRMSPAIAKGQIAFMNFIVIPMFECVSEFLPDMAFCVELTEQNKAYWQSNDDS